MNVEQDRRGLKVLRVFDGSPAKDAHIRPGDFILAVDGRPIAGVNSEVVDQPHQGPGRHERRAARVHARRALATAP